MVKYKCLDKSKKCNLIVIITIGWRVSMRMRLKVLPTLSFSLKGWTPLITIFHLLNEIMLITYIALCKKEIYKD